MQVEPAITRRAARHAALGDSTRLTIVEELTASDRSPRDLRNLLGIESNLLAHHLDVLESVGVITRNQSGGDGRRRYVRLRIEALNELAVPGLEPQQALFVCTHNSARSQLAAVLWTQIMCQPAASAGTHPAERVHPGAAAAAERAGLDLTGARPRHLASIRNRPALVITVCDRANEELGADLSRLHWSVPDPIPRATRAAFDRTIAELRARMKMLVRP